MSGQLNQQILEIDLEIPEKLVSVFEGEARYRGARGGRGSAKSQTFCKMALMRGMLKRERILCCREFQNSIKDSVHQELCDAIDELKLGWFYEYGANYIRGSNGTDFLYKGLRNNYQSVKSTKGITIALVEEAEYVSEKSWRTLLPTVRAPGSEIWIIWNPEVKDSPTNLRFGGTNLPENYRIVEMNWRDNPWFSKELNDERLADLERDYGMYLHIWEGQCITRSDAQILKDKWKIKNFVPDANWDGPYLGGDWGFSADPTVLVKCWVFENRLYIEYEALGYHVELDDIPELFDHVPDARKYKIRADSSRPETISYVKGKGFNIDSCEKWPGSVEDGIAHLRGAYKEIIIHSRCVHTIKEATLYSYKIDRLTDEVTPDIIDKNNHCIDAIRYAVGPLIKRKSKGFMNLPRN